MTRSTSSLSVLESAEHITRARHQDPHIYETGDCWRFSWAGEDRGSFDTERDARNAATRYKQQTLMQFFIAALPQG